MTNQAERKSVLGLRDLYIALVSQDDSSAYAAGTPQYFAPAVGASQSPTVNSKTQFADDGTFDVMTAEGETKIDIEVTAIPLEMQALVLGKVYDAATGRMFDNGGTPPDVALSFRSVKSNGSYLYFQYLKGKFSSPAQETATKTDSPDPKTTKITFTAVKTIYQFDLGDINDGAKRVVGDEDADGFDGATWFSNVQVPVVGSPSALSLTASPLDNATGVVVSSNQTLTFNNALDGNALLGIGLVKGSDDSAVAAAITINAARTVITINPDSNLSSATEYYITINNVTDIYGQTYANTVISFTTA